ncbi:uncharacterized protein LOC123529685 [Mercenaria mercenaria]|uniref:uncharacterized protein LOC123529685 n=1 Tax=Mercenaria mercenaria TaxID=6596 RepID=UPI00234EE393|nr:uncharacterized protein LOC123529685 [Mercenaria mercenaria]XP_045166066.2 uncharacterized protein LOC123529685 [Mercenaria mercenaria]
MAGVSGSSANLQESEIEEIKASLEGQVRVISGIGDFTNVVTIHPDGLDLHCKFQLTESYPRIPPTISVRSSVLNADQTASLTSSLQNDAATRLDHVMIADLMATCKRWLQDNQVDVTAKAVAEKSKCKKRNGKSKHENKPKSEHESIDKSSKKPPMRTAADVIKRLQWDKAVDKEDFIIGYMDRIIGLVEKKFTAFTWEDLASVDIYSLAIPQHRIQYFKYKTEKVWDKNERLDNVFGSTGGKLTLVEAVKKFEDKLKDLDDSKIGGEKKQTPEVDVIENHEEGACDGDCEDDIEVNDEFETGQGSTEQTDVQNKDSLAASRSYKRPNYFVALQVTDKTTITRLVEAQKQVMAWYPRYTDHKIPENGFHLTLAVLKLDSMSDKQACVEVMNQAKVDLERLARNTVPLIFHGVDHFSTRVIYAKVKYSQEFLVLVDKIRNVLDDAGFHMDTCSFRPHLSLFNVRRSIKWDNQSIMLNSFDDSDQKFGSQAIDNVQICQMGTLPEKESTEFYQNIFSLNIDQTV